MDSDSRKTVALASEQQLTPLVRALDKNEEVQSKVTEFAEDLSAVNAKIKQDINHPSPAESVLPTLKRIEVVEDKVQECSEELLAVNEALGEEIAERRHLERVLSDTIVAEDEARRSGLHDLLTGLPNRTLFNDRLEQALADAKRNALCLALMFIDLDNFKQINDSYGHDTGDEVLRTVAERLKSSVRANDTVSRHGGDEFMYLCIGVEKETDVINIARKLSDAISAAIANDGKQFAVQPSIGIALYPTDGEAADVLLKKADAAMYKAKQQKAGILFSSQLAMTKP